MPCRLELFPSRTANSVCDSELSDGIETSSLLLVGDQRLRLALCSEVQRIFCIGGEQFGQFLNDGRFRRDECQVGPIPAQSAALIGTNKERRNKCFENN